MIQRTTWHYQALRVTDSLQWRKQYVFTVRAVTQGGRGVEFGFTLVLTILSVCSADWPSSRLFIFCMRRIHPVRQSHNVTFSLAAKIEAIQLILVFSPSLDVRGMASRNELWFTDVPKIKTDAEKSSPWICNNIQGVFFDSWTHGIAGCMQSAYDHMNVASRRCLHS